MHIPTYFLSLQVFVSSYSQSDLVGKLIFISLFVLSGICWIVLIHKAWQTREIRKLSLSFQLACEKQKDQLLHLDLTGLPKGKFREVPHPFEQVFVSLKEKTVEILDKNRFYLMRQNQENQVFLTDVDLELIANHVSTTISSQAKKMEHNLFILSTVVTLAPFLGLLGTVWGILITFGALNGGASATSNSLILGGLSTALATTVLGLVIAIPALISYNYLKNSVRHLSSDMEDFLVRLLSIIELQYRKVDL
jgi:biopolymer transport protein TolQ